MREAGALGDCMTGAGIKGRLVRGVDLSSKRRAGQEPARRGWDIDLDIIQEPVLEAGSRGVGNEAVGGFVT